ncbi:MAG: class I SAM-dependent methyltransferase [Bacteroidales bacterium]|nr:class I SAM-dependent methyltransferase [Bacteroidales bacterium]
MQHAKILVRYLKYLLHSKTKFGVHSPFLFDLITEVFQNKTYNKAYTRIESLKSALLQNHEIIEVTDYGAGSRVNPGNKRKISDIIKNSSKSAKYGRLLHRLVQYLQPEHVIEIGTSMGLSAAYMANAVPNATVFTIEGCPNIAAKAKSNFDTLGIKNIQLIRGTFEQKLPELLTRIDTLKFAFIDGNHQYVPTLSYFEQCAAKAVNDTCLVFDDIHWSTEMEMAWNKIRHNTKVTLTVDLFFMGIVFFRQELTKQDFVIRF